MHVIDWYILIHKPGHKTDLTKFDIHALSGLLKQMLRDLSDPLLRFANYNHLITAVQMDEEKGLAVIRAVVLNLPPLNMSILQKLIEMAIKIEKHKGITKMTFHNIAVVLGPTIIFGEDESMEVLLKNSVDVIKIADHLIVSYDYIFGHSNVVNINRPVALNKEEAHWFTEKKAEEPSPESYSDKYKQVLEKGIELGNRLSKEANDKEILQSLLLQHTEEMDVLRKELDRVKESLDDAQSDEEKLRAEIKTLQEKLKTVEKNKTSISNTSQLEEKCKILEEEKKALVLKCKKSDETIAQLTESNKKQDVLYRNLEEEHTRLSQTHLKSKEGHKDLVEKIGKMDSTTSKLNDELNNKNLEYKKLEDKLAQSEAKKSKSEESAKKLEENVKKLELRVQELIQKNSSESKTSKLKDEENVKKLELRVQDLISQLASQESSYQIKLKESESKIKQLSTSKEETAKIKVLEDSNRSLNTNNKSLEDLQKSLESKVKTLEESNKSLATKIKKLEDTNKTTTKSLESVKLEKTNLLKQLETLKNQLKTSESSLKSSESSLKSLVSKNQDLEAKVQKASTQLNNQIIHVEEYEELKEQLLSNMILSIKLNNILYDPDAHLDTIGLSEKIKDENVHWKYWSNYIQKYTSK